jgi:hypothetical protein
MGYTQYYSQNRSFTDIEWGQITKFAKHLFNNQKNIVANWEGEPGTTPKVDRKVINFNGIGPDAHENFLLSKDVTPDHSFGFCKTRQKPYDTVVVALLVYIDEVAPGALHITSDGYADEWNDGLELAANLVGHIELMVPEMVKRRVLDKAN